MTDPIQPRGRRGESFADVARRTGEIAGVEIPADASDQEVLDAAVGQISDAIGDAEAELDGKVALAEAWANGTEPGGPGTKSAKESAGDAGTEADRAEAARDDAQQYALQARSESDGVRYDLAEVEPQLLYNSVGTAVSANVGGGRAALEVWLDVGTHIGVGEAIDGIQLEWAAPIGATTTRLWVIERDVATATSGGNLNSVATLAGLAPSDTLIGEYAYDPVADLGLALGTLSRTRPLRFPRVIAPAGKTYGFRLRNEDDGVVVDHGARQGSYGTVAQRRAGFFSTTANPTTFSNVNAAISPNISVVTYPTKTDIPENLSAAEAMRDGDGQALISRMNERNHVNLLAACAAFDFNLAGTSIATMFGDSLTQDGAVTTGTGYEAVTFIQSLVAGTVTNAGISGQTSAQIRARVQAATADQLAGLTSTMMGTNDYTSAKTPAEIKDEFDLCAAAITNPDFTFSAGWGSGHIFGQHGPKWRDTRDLVYAAYPVNYLAIDAMWARMAGSADDANHRAGSIPSRYALGDLLHNNRGGGAVKGKYWAANLIARAGGPPFVDDHPYVIGIKQSQASGTALVTARAFGHVDSYEILAGNEDGALAINTSTGAITRSAADVIQPYRDLFVTGANHKGEGRNGRIVIVQQADDTMPHPVRIVGNRASVMVRKTDYVAPTGKTGTFIFALQFLPGAVGGLLGPQVVAQISAESNAIRWTPRFVGGGVGDLSPGAQAPHAHMNLFSCCVDAENNIFKARVNLGTVATASITNAELRWADFLSYFAVSSGNTPLSNVIHGLTFVTTEFIDIAVDDNLEHFMDFSDFTLKDMGDPTFGGTFAAPLDLIYGMAGDLQLGLNRGSAGDFHVPMPTGPKWRGFRDVAP